jgi:hypothetical protein
MRNGSLKVRCIDACSIAPARPDTRLASAFESAE